MQTIRRTMMIAAPVERCFRLALSIDLEAEALAPWHVRAVDGVTHGVVAAGDRVTWRGWQFGLPRRHTTRVSLVRTPTYFLDVMEQGSFASYVHEHHFATMNDGTRMRDEVRFTLPLGGLGRMAEGLVRRRLEKMLTARNARIRQVAESGQWQRYFAVQPAPAA